MLRAKQLGTLSNTARSFFINGSRCGPADNTPCTCSDDETCVSRRRHAKFEPIPPQKPSNPTSRTSARIRTLISGDPIKTACAKKADSTDHSTSLPQALATPISSTRPDCVGYVGSNGVGNKETRHPSPVIADQLKTAGISAISFLSDIVNYKLPISDGSGIFNLPHNSMVDSTRAVTNIKSTQIAPRSNITRISDGVKGKGESSRLIKGCNHAPSVRTGNSKAHTVSSGTCGSSMCAPQRSNSKFSISSSYSSAKIEFLEGSNRPLRDAKLQTSIPPSYRQFASTGNVVECVSQILRQFKWGSAAEEALGNLGSRMDAYQANQVLKHISDHSVALGFFNWLKRLPGFKHDGHSYTTMVGILGRSKQFGAVNKLLDQMVEDGCRPNVVTYNRLIHSYGRANYLKDAVRVFNQMQEAGCRPDRVTYCTLIDIHAKAGFLDFALHMYRRMLHAGLSPDTFTYSVMINCLGKAGNLSAAHRLFCEMIDRGCVPNLVTYNIMIALQAKTRNYEAALELYRDMKDAGFEPDRVTYSIVMEVLGNCGCLEEAEEVFNEMKRKNWVPDEPVYGLLVDLWGKAGNVEKAWNWYLAMLKAGLCPNVPTCNSLLSTFLRFHQLSDAYNLLHSMLALGLSPSLQTYTLLLSCCTEAKSAFNMGFCSELMAVTGHPAHSFLISMPSAGLDGQNVRDHTGEFLDLMHCEDRESKRGLVDAVVDFLHKSGLKEEAGSVWEVAAQKNVYPDAVKEKASCYWLINLHVMSDGTAITALSRTLAWFRRRMLVSGVCPVRIDIVTGWGRRSRVTGTSLVRQAVHELLRVFGFPFTENSNSGCFIGHGEVLGQWLQQSYVERMHLL